MSKLTRKQALQLAAESLVDPRTITKIFSGGVTKPLVRERVALAAKKLKIEMPMEVGA